MTRHKSVKQDHQPIVKLLFPAAVCGLDRVQHAFAMARLVLLFAVSGNSAIAFIELGVVPAFGSPGMNNQIDMASRFVLIVVSFNTYWDTRIPFFSKC
jgi:hypothetical protein